MPERNLAGRRVALYARVSRDVGSRSVDDQLTDGRAWLPRTGATSAGEYRDDGVGASAYSKGTREDWPRLMAELEAGRFDVLWTWEISRATRDRAVWAALVTACITHGVLLAERDRVYDLTDEDEAFALDLQQILGVREVGKIRRRTKRAAGHRRARGEPHGRVHDGLKIEYDPTSGKPLRRVLDPERAPILRDIVSRLLAGESAYAVARALNDRGVRTGSGAQWRGENIVRRVASPSLAGLVEHDGRLIDATWPGVITRTEHDRLVAMLADEARQKFRRGPHVRFLLSGIGHCGVCGAPLRAIPKRRKDGSDAASYGCSAGKEGTAPGWHVARLCAPVDAYVGGAVVKFLSRPDVLAELADGEDDAERQVATARAAELTAELARARDMLKAGRLSLESLSHLESWALPEIEACERRARPAHVPAAVYDVAGPQAAARWEATPVAARREIVSALLTVTLHKADRSLPFDATSVVIERRRR